MCCRAGLGSPGGGRGTGAVLRGRARRAAVPTRRWPGPSRHFPASPRPAPPRPAGTQSSSPHRQSDPPASLPASSSPPPNPRPRLVHFQSLLPVRERRRKQTMAVYLGMLRLGKLCIASLRARGPRTLLSRPRPNSKLQGVRALRYSEQLSEKRGGWAVRRWELGSSAQFGRG